MNPLPTYMRALIKHETLRLFASPQNTVFLVAFVFCSHAAAFLLAGLFEIGQASLDSFFLFHPWLHLLFCSALAMNLWTDDKRSGAVDILLTLPAPAWALAAAKHFASWLFILLALILTFPIWLTVNYLGDPDNLVILSAYLGSFLVAGCYLALGQLASAVTKSPVSAFVLSLSLGLLFTLNGLPFLSQVLQNTPPAVAQLVNSFSILSHFSSLQKGLLNADALVFFISFIPVFIAAAALVVAARIPHPSPLLPPKSVRFLLLGVVLLGSNLFAPSLQFLRLDLTRNHAHTLSPNAVAALQSLATPITLRFFFSQNAASSYPILQSHGQRVGETLRAIASHTNGTLKIQTLDPTPFSPQEDLAIALGLKPAPLDAAARLYLGVSASNTIDDARTIPYLPPQRDGYLEHDLVSLILSLADTQKPVLGLLGDSPVDKPQPFVAFQAISSLYDVRRLSTPLNAVPDDVRALLIVHPEDMDNKTLYAVDQFALKGRGLFIVVDPVAEHIRNDPDHARNHHSHTPHQPPQNHIASNLQPLLSAWGVQYDPSLILADRDRAQRVSLDPNAVNSRRAVVDYPLWILLNSPDDINQNDASVSHVRSVALATAGALTHNPPNASSSNSPNGAPSFSPILSSSQNSALLDVAKAPLPPDDIQRALIPEQSYVIAARLRGNAHSAFPDPPPPPTPNSPAHIPQGPLHAVVLADADAFSDSVWLQTRSAFGQSFSTPIADNNSFLLALTASVLANPHLAALNAKPSSSNPFHRVVTLRRNAEIQYLLQEQSILDAIQSTEQQLQTSSPDAKTAENLRRQLLSSRAGLRDVQRKLRADVDQLAVRVKIFNILIVPLLIALLAAAAFIKRNQRRSAARRAARLGAQEAS